MADLGRCTAILLAAGASARFGAPDKLIQPLAGRPLLLHAAERLQALPFQRRLAVVARADGAGGRLLRTIGFELVENDAAHTGLASSIRAGIRAARESESESALIALADMPFVPADHFAALVERLTAADAAVASHAAGRKTVPAAFRRGLFAQLLGLTGDAGARDLLRAATPLPIAPTHLADVDTPDDLARAQSGGGA
jgi:molybdenum cofactor cytidylyltransferase